MYVDSYTVLDGLVKVSILLSKSGQYVYWVEEPRLSKDEEEVLMKIRSELSRATKPTSMPFIDDYGKIREYIRSSAEALLKQYLRDLNSESANKVMYYVLRDSVGFGSLEPLINDPRVEDIHINGPDRSIYVWHSKYGHIKTNVTINTDELERMITLISQRIRKNASSANPVLEGLLIPENFRVEMLLRDVAPMGPMVTIRKFREVPLTVIDMIKLGTLSSELVAYLWLMLDYGRNMLIIGPTGAGKTTLLNALLFLIRNGVRIITIEDARELYLLHDHWVPLVSRTSDTPGVANIDLYELVKVSMRLRPDYIVVGELRGEESYVFFQALASGHTGLSTLHANSAELAVRRLLSKPMNIPPALLMSLNVIIQINIVNVKRDEVARRVTRVEEVIDVQEDRPVLNRVFEWVRDEDRVTKLNESVLINRVAEDFGLSVDVIKNELNRRKMFIDLMVKNGASSPSAVFEYINRYYTDPESAFKSLEGS